MVRGEMKRHLGVLMECHIGEIIGGAWRLRMCGKGVEENSGPGQGGDVVP